MRSEWEKMVGGEPYWGYDEELVARRQRARELLRAINDTFGGDVDARTARIRELFGAVGEGIWIEPPFFCDYGTNIRVGRNVFFNFNCVVLDTGPVSIGSHTMFGPAVQIYTATHPLNAAERRREETARPVAIGDDVWVGGGAVILPGVTIGSEAVIGAGSVVTSSIPPGVLAVGNPCRVIRQLP